jgi:serine/threonine protein kinase
LTLIKVDNGLIMAAVSSSGGSLVTQIAAFDGQTLWAAPGQPIYEVGNFLGGGAAGTVYEATHKGSFEHYALKILNPLGYKIMPSSSLRRCTVVSKGTPCADSTDMSLPLGRENVWWLLYGNGSTKQYVTAYFSEKFNELREMNLFQCRKVWTQECIAIENDDDEEAALLNSPDERVQPVQGLDGSKVFVPTLPTKFAEFMRKRGRIFREIRNMRKIANHLNVIQFVEVLELTQDSKSTIFVVMELANGGELFDRIKIDYGTREDTAKRFFKQLVDGVLHCHNQGVCHRDLKPENLLLMDTPGQETILKIADFGFSTRFVLGLNDGTPGQMGGEAVAASPHTVFTILGNSDEVIPASSPLRTLTSVVGSPFYVAPEVLQAKGYSGPKADVWSLGVILYAMLAGNLPFGEDLSNCKRFRYFCQWIREASAQGNRFWENQALEFPAWLFPAKFSVPAKGLIVSMLHPDPSARINVSDAMAHPWVPVTLNLSMGMQSSGSMGSMNSASTASGIGGEGNDGSMPFTISMDQPGMDADDGDGDGDGELFRMEEDDEEPRMTNDTPEQTEQSLLGDELVSQDPTSSMQQQMQQLAMSPPPVAPPHMGAHAVTTPDLFNPGADADEFVEHHEAAPVGAMPVPGAAVVPPTFHNSIKRSTRFITSVPAHDVLEKVATVLDTCYRDRVMTTIGLIGSVTINSNNYYLEAKAQPEGPVLFALQILKVADQQASDAIACSPSLGTSPLDALTSGAQRSDLYVVEFIRGQVEIFPFKRFYSWLRQEVAELVKRETAFNYLDQASSPMIDSTLMSRYSHILGPGAGPMGR